MIVSSDSYPWLAKLNAQDIWTRMQCCKPALVSQQLCVASLLHHAQVSMKGDLYNIYTDTEGEQQTSLLGNVQDLRSIKVKEIAGIPIEKLQAHYDIQRNRAGKKDAGMPDRMIGFPDQTPVPLPPGTVNVYKVDMPPGDTICSGMHYFWTWLLMYIRW